MRPEIARDRSRWLLVAGRVEVEVAGEYTQGIRVIPPGVV